jgi:transcriptional regulator with XRE-family HTH domain
VKEFPRDVATGFSVNLVRLRGSAGLSQEELGMRAGLHRTEIGLLERGARIPRLDTIIKVAGGLSISPCELIEGMTWEPGDRTPGMFGLAPGQARPTKPSGSEA